MKKTLTTAACLILAAAAFAAEPAKTKEADKTAQPDRQQMIEQHEKMAQLHQRTADCLKSGSSVQECHDAMMKASPMKDGQCPFMGEDCPMCGKGGMGRGPRGRGGRGMRRMMNGSGTGPGANAPAQTPAPSDKPATP